MQHTPNATPAEPTAHVDAMATWTFDDDLAIGCECAYPMLQIERWGQDFDATTSVQHFN